MFPPRLQRPIKQALFLAVLLTLFLAFPPGTCAQDARASAALHLPSSVSRAQGITGYEGMTGYKVLSGYEGMMGAIAAVLEREFGLVVSQTKLHLYPNREAFQSNLVHIVRFDPVYAREVAGWAVAVAAPEMVLANEEALKRISRSERIRVLAHELVHTVQYGLSSGRRSTSDQWLREGFADWIAYRVLEYLEPGSPTLRASDLARIKDTVHRQSCAPLSKMVTLEGFGDARSRYGGTATYGGCLLAVDLLVKRYGIESVLNYFSLFGQSDDRIGNFKAAFGQDLAAFEKDFQSYRATSLQ